MKLSFSVGVRPYLLISLMAGNILLSYCGLGWQTNEIAFQGFFPVEQKIYLIPKKL